MKKLSLVLIVLLAAVLFASCSAAVNNDQAQVSTAAPTVSATTVAEEVKPEPTPTATPTPTPEQTKSPEKIMELLKSVEVPIIESKKVVQNEKYKALYPDMLAAIIKNNAADTIKNLQVSFLAYDEGGYPIKPKMQFSFDEPTYEVIGTADDANIKVGKTFGEDYGWKLDDESASKVAYVLACVKSAELYNGQTWTNKYYQDWLDTFIDKPLPDFLMK